MTGALSLAAEVIAFAVEEATGQQEASRRHKASAIVFLKGGADSNLPLFLEALGYHGDPNLYDTVDLESDVVRTAIARWRLRKRGSTIANGFDNDGNVL